MSGGSETPRPAPTICAAPGMADTATALAREVALQLGRALVRRGRAVLAVPGGRTPEAFLAALAGQPLDWSRVTVLPGDERVVPPDSPRSNAGLIRRSLLRGGAAGAGFLPLVTDGADPRAEAARAALRVAPLLPLDVCVLGMGTDGHVASLFPGAEGLDAALAEGAPPVLPLSAPAAPEPRVSLTAPVLRGARHLHLLIAGARKRAVLDSALEPGPVSALPVRLVLERPDLVVHHAAEEPACA